MEEWVKKLQENAKVNTRNQVAALKTLETQIEQLTKEFHTKTTNDINSPSLDQYLGASVNVIPKSIFKHLKLARLKKTDMIVEMADMIEISPIGIVENVMDIHKRTKMKPKWTKPSTRLEEREKMKPRTYSSLMGQLVSI
ncbi:hypothetical protein Tco_1312451 [Tanacetum coccineum]